MGVRGLASHVGTITVILTLAGLMVSLGPGSASAGTCAGWTGTQPESPESGDTFASVADLSLCNAWAVGSAPDGGGFAQTLAEHFNGIAWVQVASSNPGGSASDNVLTGVAVKSPSDGWAVGEYSNGTADQTLIEQLTGGAWEQVPSANPGGSSHDNTLSGVAIESPTSAWAVGSYNTGTRTRSLIERWSGGAWSQVPSPSPSGTENELSGVTATSATDAWAVGRYVDGDGFAQTLILHWNGATWKRVTSPDVGGLTTASSLSAVAATSASSAWAVGSSLTGNPPGQALIVHWNGQKWQRMDAASLSRPAMSGSLTGVTALAAGDVWAVGFSGNLGSTRTLTAHWNGTKWALIPSPVLGPISEFTAVAASSPTDLWVVGYYNILIDAPDFAMAFHRG
jgi:hypothetical protein